MNIPISVGQRVRASAGFSLLELVVVIAIIAVLMAIAVTKYLAIAVEAERVAMEGVVGTLRSAISMKMAEHVVQSKTDKLPLLENSNPMEQLSQTPSNYLGELASSEAVTAPGGNWYFDRSERSLVYRVNNVGYFETELAGPPRARFRVRLQFEDRNGNGVFDAGKDKLEGVVLTPLEPYRWLNY